MTLRELYELSIRLGMKHDLRGEEALRAQLAQRREEYERLPEWQRPFYDQERFHNPYGDVRIARGPDDTELTTVLLGVDIHIPELLLADRLREKGRRIDAVIAHHVHGVGRSAFLPHDFMTYDIDSLVAEGVGRSAAEALILPYIEAKLAGMEDNHSRGPDVAELLDLPFACIHTPADFYISVGVQAALDEAKPATLADTIPALLTIPEIASAATRLGALPRIFGAPPEREVGRVFHKFGGGYIFPPSAYALLGAAGVRTVFQIHCEPIYAEAAAAAGVAIVRVPHAAGDNIGLNLLLDDVENELGPLEVIGCGGFERHSRRQLDAFRGAGDSKGRDCNELGPSSRETALTSVRERQ